MRLLFSYRTYLIIQYEDTTFFLKTKIFITIKQNLMKKVIKLTESDLVRIVRKVISENALPTFDYIFRRNDGVNEPTVAEELYFISNGDSFDVWMKEYKKDGSIGRVVDTGKQLPTLDELGVSYNESNANFKNNDEGLNGNNVARLITPSMERAKGNWIFFVNDEGIPTKGKLRVSGDLPIKGMLDTKGDGHPLKDGEVITGYDYFIKEKPSRRNEYGKGIALSIEDMVTSKKP